MKKSISVPVIFVLVLIGLFLVFLAGHNTGYRLALNEEARGFELPPGDVADGKTVFMEKGCHQCHTVAGSPEFAIPSEEKAANVLIGGKVRVIKSCGQLVTDITQPQANVKKTAPESMLTPSGESSMPDFTVQLTVQELADLVSFLQLHYDVDVPQYPDNPYYYPYGVDVIP